MTLLHNIWVKRLPFYVAALALAWKATPALFNDFDGPMPMRILGILIVLFIGGGVLCMIIYHIQRAISKRQEVGCDEKGLYISREFIPWERIQEFKASRDSLPYKSIHVIVKDQEAEIQAMRNPIQRFLCKLEVRGKGTIHCIEPELFNGSADAFVAYLEEERKRYVKE